jgi:hypothetical protein
MSVKWVTVKLIVLSNIIHYSLTANNHFEAPIREACFLTVNAL